MPYEVGDIVRCPVTQSIGIVTSAESGDSASVFWRHQRTVVREAIYNNEVTGIETYIPHTAWWNEGELDVVDPISDRVSERRLGADEMQALKKEQLRLFHERFPGTTPISI